ncbi:MAG: PAS domain S-box protein [Candidatus Marinimicrobia bacterium]|nr:PAS domain S-box protein [Candidatus Neomarinimicrobiota bacterium]
MKNFKDFSIKNKLRVIILGIVSSMLIFGFVILGIISANIIKDNRKSEAEILAKLIGEYSITSLDFNYPERGSEILEKLKNNPNVLACYVFDQQGNPFAHYIKEGTGTGLGPLTVLTQKYEHDYLRQNKVYIVRKITYNEQIYGWIYLIIDSQIHEIIKTAIIVFSGLFTILFIISFILTSRFQKFISLPISKLAKITSKITRYGKYHYRLEKSYNDEVGNLYDEFNNMLSAIEKREQEKALAQQKIIENEVWVQTILNNLNDAIFVHDIESRRIIYVNDTASKLYGYTVEETLKLPIGQISGNDEVYNQDTADKIFNNCLKMGPQNFEWHARKKDNTLFWVECNMRKALLGNAERMMVVVKDIDERKKQQKELRDLQNYLIDIINSMPSIIIGTNENLVITHWNQKAELFTGLSSQNIIGKTLHEIASTLPGELCLNIQVSIDTMKPVLLEKIEMRKGKERLFFNVTIYPLSSTDTKGAVVRIDDITDRILMEELMIQSEKMLSVGGLAAGMAHEINNPLAGMMQNATVVLNRLTKYSPKNADVAVRCGTSIEAVSEFMQKRDIVKHLELIYDSGKRASGIISNMLSFARKSDSNFRYAQLPEILDMSLELAKSDYNLRKKYDFRKVQIIKDYESKLPECFCDPGKIEQVFLNLLKNGAQAMGELTERDSVFILRIYRHENYFVIEIEDNGPGIDEGTRRRIFEPFFTTKKVGQGTGLGLSVSYFIITDNHHGIMQVESTKGKGTKFIIKLPEKKK